MRLGKKKRSNSKNDPNKGSSEKAAPPLEGNSNSGDGFISLDISDIQDDNASIMTSRFQEYEDNLSDRSESEEEDEDEGPRRKRKRDDNDDKDTNNKKRMSEFPWLRDHSDIDNMADWLTEEIKDFVAYVSPAESEIVARNDAMRRIRNLVHGIWSDAEAHVFGSYATDLYLPGSDIDMVILSDSGRYDTKDYLFQLSSKLRREGVAKKVEPIAKARVPIIKMVEAQTNINVDISFEKRNGVKTVNKINEWREMFPELRCFILVIKQFLARRRLNEVHTGGLGGFSIICMVVSFLKNHPRVGSGELTLKDNLGVLVIEFFELYGKKFNYDDVALCMTGRMGYLSKRDNPHLQNKNSFSLAIEDPNDDTNNISRGSFHIPAVKRAFSGAFDMLTARCFDLNEMPRAKRRGKSILGQVLKLKGPERDFEDSTGSVRNEYADVKVAKKTEPQPSPQVMYISDDSSDSQPDDTAGNDYIVLSDSDDENDSRNNIIKPVDKQTKRDFWSSKAGTSS